MDIKDLIITPFYFLLLSGFAYAIRPYVTTPSTRKFFLPALWVRFVGAIGLGLLYQYWYEGGDTFNYFTHGSKWIYEAFWADFSKGLSLLLENGGGSRVPETFDFSQHIWYYRDPQSYFVVRITGFLDLFTFHTYSATAVLFATFSFSGSWAFYTAVAKKYPKSSSWIAFALLFVPSVVFWGSGILKDTITLGALGWLTWAMVHIIDLGDRGFRYWLVVFVSVWLVFSIKIYILICFVPTLFIWIYWKQIQGVRNQMVKILIAPMLFVFFCAVGFLAMSQVSSYSDKYSIESIAERAAITAYDIRYGWGARTGGDGGYDLGVLDGSWQSMVRLMPAAINVSLFRPYPWEVRNPLMLLSAIESFAVFILALWFFVYKNDLLSVFKDPFLVFCFIFALLFAFAVGVSTFNFGTLMRYKIPMISFFLLVILSGKRQK